MPRLNVFEKSKTTTLSENIHTMLQDRLARTAAVSCPVEFIAAAVRLLGSESCGKCTPCRVGLAQLARLYDAVLDGVADAHTVSQIEELSEHIYRSSDCAIGYEAGALSLNAVRGFREDFLYHVEKHDCGAGNIEPVPCRGACPANVDVPAYLALVAAGRYTDAIRVVRKDNPLAVVCGLICEHPCELACRRGIVDDPINIRGIKRFAAEHSANDPVGDDYTPQKAEPTGKKIAIIGGGPSGLTAAYYLALMGHTPTIYEQRKLLGGMMRYGIPSYRLPHNELDREIDWLLAAGVEVKTGVQIGGSGADSISIADLKAEHDAIYVAIGAHSAATLGIAGEDAKGVYSAVEILRRTGAEVYPDFTGKTVCVVGGGNVAMDVARSAQRLGASKVRVVYRRRKIDMTAQIEEIEAAVAEGCEILELAAPVRIETKAGNVSGLAVQPQIISVIQNGRAKPVPAVADEQVLTCDAVIVAIGQVIDSAAFASYGLPVNRERLVVGSDGSVQGFAGFFSGGDCVTGPTTVIRAVSAGKTAAAAIDEYLGYEHKIELAVEVPSASFSSRVFCARSEMLEVHLDNLVGNFSQTEQGLLPEEALQEASRCLRCDCFGLGALREGRHFSW